MINIHNINFKVKSVQMILCMINLRDKTELVINDLKILRFIPIEKTKKINQQTFLLVKSKRNHSLSMIVKVSKSKKVLNLFLTW